MMNEETSIYLAIGTLILGWILGIFGNVINEKLKRHSSKKDIISGIITELTELQIHLSTVSLMSFCMLDAFNKEYFTWVKPHFINSFKSAESIFPKNLLNKPPDINKLNDEELFLLIKNTFVKDPNDPRPKAYTYQKITIPFIDSKIDDIALLKTTVQNLLLVLKRDINFLNNDTNQIWFFNSKTYDSPTQENFARLNVNINNLYARIGTRAKIVVDNIDKIFLQLN
jgi:hypothetical protein